MFSLRWRLSVLRLLRLPCPLPQPCTDLARDGSRICTYGRRCNFAHPGEAIRRVGTGVVADAASDAGHSGGGLADAHYVDREYHEAMQLRYPKHKCPFGVFV